MQSLVRMVFGLIALSAGCMLIAASGSGVLATPAKPPKCNDSYEDEENFKSCKDDAVLCKSQGTETECKNASTNALEVNDFPKQCVTKNDHYCGEHLRPCHKAVDCEWTPDPMDPNKGTCEQKDDPAGFWQDVTGPKGTADCGNY